MARNTTPPAGRPAPGARLEVEITAVGAGGNAIARHEGFTLIVPRGVLGERVRVVVEKVQPRYAMARRETVLQPGPGVTEPLCPHFEDCRGCDWQHLNYATQLAQKKLVLEDQLARIGGVKPPEGWEIIPCEHPFEYRDKLEFTVVRQGETFLPALHGDPGSAPVPIEQCRLAPPAHSAVARVAAAIFASGQLSADTPASAPSNAPANAPAESPKHRPHWAEGRGKPGRPAAAGGAGLVRLTVQNTAGGPEQAGLALNLHFPTSPSWLRDKEARAALLARLEAEAPEVKTVAVSLTGAHQRGRRRAGLGQELVKGSPLLTKSVGGRQYLVPPLQFFQVNPSQAARMVAEVIEGFAQPLLTGKETRPPLILDLFCGVGLFSLPLSDVGFRVAGIEKEGDSVRAARETARAHDNNRCVFQAADLGQRDILADLVRRHNAPVGILVNPPRAGLPTTLAEDLLKYPAQRLLYVSCDSGTLARDIKRLAPRYQLTALRGFDLFPQTHHLELLATFDIKQ